MGNLHSCDPLQEAELSGLLMKAKALHFASSLYSRPGVIQWLLTCKLRKTVSRKPLRLGEADSSLLWRCKARDLRLPEDPGRC